MFDITALGELLIDFTSAGNSTYGNLLFERNPGGAPANMLAAASKLGLKTAFIGKVGDDLFGRFLEQTLKNNHIDTKGLRFSKTESTTLAFVQLDEYGDRSFSFYRNPGADMMLEDIELEEEIIKESKLLHFGSISMTNEPARSATLKALSIAKKNNCIISFDPNLRPLLWKSLDDAREQILSGLKLADLIKISDEELEFITGERDLPTGTTILAELGIKLIVVTLGAKGSFYRIGDITGYTSTYDVKVLDTTGAGDAFWGGVLFKLKNVSLSELKNLSAEAIENIMDFANAVGACTTTKKGGIPAIPQFNEVEYCMRHVPKLS